MSSSWACAFFIVKKVFFIVTSVQHPFCLRGNGCWMAHFQPILADSGRQASDGVMFKAFPLYDTNHLLRNYLFIFCNTITFTVKTSKLCVKTEDTRLWMDQGHLQLYIVSFMHYSQSKKRNHDDTNSNRSHQMLVCCLSFPEVFERNAANCIVFKFN